jgi:hypothetical protein
MCDHTAESIDVGDWGLARDRVVDECTECGCGGDSRDFVNTLGISAGSPAGAEAANAGRDQLTKTSRLSTDTYRDPA